jgi:NAD(P)-dependent dehydrogenase (short-subunit alcohol dehydrogenase family)
MTRLEKASVEEWKTLYDVNFFSGLALVYPGPDPKARAEELTIQIKATIPALRESKGCVVWVSSGAATSCYTAWAAYGSSKAALNSLSGHLAVEEPDITSIAISPGRVDTEMQRELRETGTAMKPGDRQSFVDAFEKGELIKPEVPGRAIARLVVGPPMELSGKYFKYVASILDVATLTDDRLTAPELASYVSW